MVYTVTLNGYSDAELGRLIRKAIEDNGGKSQARMDAHGALMAVARIAGYGWIEDALQVAKFAWLAMVAFMRRLFSSSQRDGRQASSRSGS